MGHHCEPLSGEIISAAMAVYRELGLGFLESIYENAMKTALRHRGITYEAQKEVTIVFEGEEAGVPRLALIVERRIVVELKAAKQLEDVPFAQLRSFLKATHLHVGLLNELQYAKTDRPTSGPWSSTGSVIAGFSRERRKRRGRQRKRLEREAADWSI